MGSKHYRIIIHGMQSETSGVFDCFSFDIQRNMKSLASGIGRVLTVRFLLAVFCMRCPV